MNVFVFWIPNEFLDVECTLHSLLLNVYGIYTESPYISSTKSLNSIWNDLVISQGHGNLRRWCNSNYFEKHGNDPLTLASSYWDWMNVKDSYAFLVTGFGFRFQVQYRIMQQFIKKSTHCSQAVMITNRQCYFRKSPMTMKVLFLM